MCVSVIASNGKSNVRSLITHSASSKTPGFNLLLILDWMIRAYVFTEQNQPTMLSFSCNGCDEISSIYDGFNGSMCMFFFHLISSSFSSSTEILIFSSNHCSVLGPFKQTSWDKDSWSEPAKNFFKSSQINLASEVPYT